MLASGPVLGVVAGWALRGDIRRLARIRLDWAWLLVAALVIRVAAGAGGDLAATLYVLAFCGITLVAIRNRDLPGMPLIAFGAVLNLIVVAANAGMPVDASALAAAGARMPEDALHVEMGEATALAILADRIPMPVVRSVYSVGDVLLTAGGFWLPFAGMLRK